MQLPRGRRRRAHSPGEQLDGEQRPHLPGGAGGARWGRSWGGALAVEEQGQRGRRATRSSGEELARLGRRETCSSGKEQARRGRRTTRSTGEDRRGAVEDRRGAVARGRSRGGAVAGGGSGATWSPGEDLRSPSRKKQADAMQLSSMGGGRKVCVATLRIRDVGPSHVLVAFPQNSSNRF